MDMLRALLLVATEQGRAQGAAHLRHDAGYQLAGHQPGALPYHDLAGGRAAAQVRAIGGCSLPLTFLLLYLSVTYEKSAFTDIRVISGIKLIFWNHIGEMSFRHTNGDI